MSTALTADHQASGFASFDDDNTALPLRGDTFLGVCEAVGQDLGFHANWLRIPFAALILWNPPVVIASYLGLGCVVAVSRWIFPVRRAATAAAPKLEAVASNEAPLSVENQGSKEKELLAA